MVRLKNKTHTVCVITIQQERAAYKENRGTTFIHDKFLVDIKNGNNHTSFCTVRPCQMWAKIIQEANVFD